MDFLEFLTKVATLVTAIVAVIGISAWRRDFVGRRKIELAEDTLAQFYKIADVIRAMRNPFSFGNEHDELTQEPGEARERFEARKLVGPLFRRYRENQDSFAQLWAVRYRFIARFGKDAGKPFEDLNHIVNTLFVHARMRVETARFTSNDAELKAIREHESYIWALDDQDDINKRLDRVIRDIEAVCKLVIYGNAPLAGKLSRWLETAAHIFGHRPKP